MALYAEYIPMMFKSVFITILIIKYSSSSTNLLKVNLFLTIVFHGGILFNLLPLSLLNTTVRFSSLPLGVLSKLLQLTKMIQIQSSGSVSSLTWALNSLASLSRSITLFMSVKDKFLLVSITASTLLNLSISLTAVYYKNKEKVEEISKSK